MPKHFLVPLILAIGFHALVVGLFLIEWPQDQVDRVSQAPLYISAALIGPNASKIDRDQDTPRSKAVVNKPAAESKVKPKVKIDQEKVPIKPVKPVEAAPVPALAAIKPIQNDPVVPAQNKAADALMAAVTEEIGRQAVTNDEQVLAYIGQIQREIVSRWSRPPSARNGMQVVLRVRLVPTGEVVDVGVEQSSGNDAFDRSALLAVERSERFQVPSASRLFEKNFRSFTVLFRPEDLLL